MLPLPPPPRTWTHAGQPPANVAGQWSPPYPRRPLCCQLCRSALLMPYLLRLHVHARRRPSPAVVAMSRRRAMSGRAVWKVAGHHASIPSSSSSRAVGVHRAPPTLLHNLASPHTWSPCGPRCLPRSDGRPTMALTGWVGKCLYGLLIERTVHFLFYSLFSNFLKNIQVLFMFPKKCPVFEKNVLKIQKLYSSILLYNVGISLNASR